MRKKRTVPPSIPQGTPTPLDVASHQRAQGFLIAGHAEDIRNAREARAQSQRAQNIVGRNDLYPSANNIGVQTRLRMAGEKRRQFVAQAAAGPTYQGR